MQVHILEVKFSFQGAASALYPVMLKSDRECFLVDCGYAGFLPMIEEAANRQGLSLNDLTGIIVTHHDLDHIGGLFEITEKYPALKVYASGGEAPYISGQQKSLRLQQAEDLFDALPEAHKEGARQFQEMLQSIKPVKVDETFEATEAATFRHGIKIIPTPGHTPGHISIFLEETKTLIAADAVVFEAGEFDIANPYYTLDLAQALASVKKLLTLAPERVICYHGGLVEHNSCLKLESLLAKYPVIN